MAFAKIKIILIESDEARQEYLREQIEGDHTIVVEAVLGEETMVEQALEQVNPDILVLSGLDGEGKIAQLLNWVKRCQAIPVLAIAHTMAEQMFLSHSGADDVILCNSSESTADSRRFSLMLQLKIKSLIRPRTVRIRSKTVPVDDIPKPVMPEIGSARMASTRLIAIGASLGGVEATLTLLQALPPTLPGIVIVQHMPPGFTRSYAQRLDRETPFSVKEAMTGNVIADGGVWIARGGEQLTVYQSGAAYCIRSSPGAKVNGFCPSVDVLFHSVARQAGARAAGIILTGIGRDGAAGLKAMHDRGAPTWGQSAASCVVYGMPAAARQVGAVDQEMNLIEMAKVVRAYFRNYGIRNHNV